MGGSNRWQRGFDLKTIGKYEITDEIGRGAMGEVYKARDPLIGRMVALKVITSGLTNKPELLERFYQEARSAGALQHPNIVTVYELGKEGELPFIAMEYLGGDSLEKLIARKEPLPLAQKVGYVIQICRALEYAHKHGVVHRDIKPGNIMGTTEGAVKVVDFGIARLVDASKTQTGTLIGTLGYMSPQQLRGEHADERSDIWAVGVLFYELLSYQRPFLGENPAALMMSIISKEPPPLSGTGADCTPEVEAVIFRMLQKEALDRYQTMEEVLLDLDPVWKQLQQARVSELVAESQRIRDDDLQGAQKLLREALHADSSNYQAKTLLDKISKELRRQQVLPRLKEQLARAQEKLEAGKYQEAKAEAHAALQLDSTYQPAREMLAEVEEAVKRVREIDTKLRGSKQRIAEGSLTEADRQLDDILALDPENPQAQELRHQIRDEVSRRAQRKQLSEAIRQARDLWSQQRYADCIAGLLELQGKFPDNTEVAQLLETARNDQQEAGKQTKLAEARTLLGNQKYEEARNALSTLRKDFPNDTAIENLFKLAADEQGLEKQQQRLEQEISKLRSLVNKGKHAEALKSGEALLQEFPQEFELTELVNFARGEVKRAGQAKRLNDAIGRARELVARDSFAEAARAAEKALAEFPGNADLAALREEARKKQDEKQRRDQIEKRIREVQTKITSNELTDAIELARETIAVLGPDTNVTRLLESAEVEQLERAKKKEQDQKVEEAQSLLKAGKVPEAGQVLDQALAARLLDASDPRVKTLLSEVEKKKQELAAAAPPAPVATKTPKSKEIAPPAKVSSASSVPGTAKPAETKPAPPAPPAKERVPAKEPKSEPAKPTPKKEASPAPAAGARREAPKPREQMRPAPAATAEPPKSKKTLLIAVAGIAIAAAVGAGFYFSSTGSKTPPAPVASQPAATATNPPAEQPPASAAPENPPAPPAKSAEKTPPVREKPAEPVKPASKASKAVHITPPVKSGPSPSEELQQLVTQYNAGTDDPAALRSLQEQFRALEKNGGSVGHQARLYAERRIPRDLKDLEATAATPLPQTPTQARTAPSSAPAPTRRFVWAVSVDSSSVSGVQLRDHPLPTTIVAQAAAQHRQFELQFSIDAEGHVTGGRVLSGDPSLGNTLVNQAKQSWHFSVPEQQAASAKVSVQF